MKTHTARWIQDTRQEANKYGCNIKTRDENHHETYRHIKCLYVGREGDRISDTEGVIAWAHEF